MNRNVNDHIQKMLDFNNKKLKLKKREKFSSTRLMKIKQVDNALSQQRCAWTGNQTMTARFIGQQHSTTEPHEPGCIIFLLVKIKSVLEAIKGAPLGFQQLKYLIFKNKSHAHIQFTFTE